MPSSQSFPATALPPEKGHEPPEKGYGLGGFDYAVLPASVRRAVSEQTASIHGLLAKTSVSVVQIGLRLKFVRDRLGRAHFQPWLAAEFHWSQPTASNYMRAAAEFAQVESLDKFQPSALFLLARKSVPEAARSEAIGLAGRGDPITKATALEIVSRHQSQVGLTSSRLSQLRRVFHRALPKLSPQDLRAFAAEVSSLADEMAVSPRRDP